MPLPIKLISEFDSTPRVKGVFLNSKDWLITQNLFPELEADLIDCRGVYFLCFNSLVVYVGMSGSCIYNRVFSNPFGDAHIQKGWVFNQVRVLDMGAMPTHQILEKETEFITFFNPYYNVKGVDASKETPLSLPFDKRIFSYCINNIQNARAMQIANHLFFSSTHE